MKTMKRFFAAVIAVTSVMAIAPISAFAENETGGTTTVLFNAVIEPAYTITIPASVELSDTETAKATIKAEEVYLDTTKHKQINVTLDSASHTKSGNTFHAENDKGDSTATYTINGGDVAVGGVVATFTKDGSKDLTFSTASGATYAGTHSETLTFGISVEEAVTTRTVTWGNTEIKAFISAYQNNQSYSNGGITLSFGGGRVRAGFMDEVVFDPVTIAYEEPYVFSTSSGKIIKIESNMLRNSVDNDWIDGVWTGSASSVKFDSGTLKELEIKFTIEE